MLIKHLKQKCIYFDISSLFKAGLEIGEMILAVNKDSLVGANYDTVSKTGYFI